VQRSVSIWATRPEDLTPLAPLLAPLYNAARNESQPSWAAYCDFIATRGMPPWRATAVGFKNLGEDEACYPAHPFAHVQFQCIRPLTMVRGGQTC